MLFLLKYDLDYHQWKLHDFFYNIPIFVFYKSILYLLTILRNKAKMEIKRKEKYMETQLKKKIEIKRNIERKWDKTRERYK